MIWKRFSILTNQNKCTQMKIGFELIIYAEEDFQFSLIKINIKKKIFSSHWSKWIHTNENRFWMIKRRFSNLTDQNECTQIKIDFEW